jgi:hypothetical protein
MSKINLLQLDDGSTVNFDEMPLEQLRAILSDAMKHLKMGVAQDGTEYLVQKLSCYLLNLNLDNRVI